MPSRRKKTGAPLGNKNAVGNPGGGRPALYHDGIPAICYRLALLGATDAEMCDVVGVSESTFNAWKRDHLEFFAALKAGKLAADGEVAQALFRRAVGFTHEVTRKTIPRGAKKATTVVEQTYYPPDTAAAKHWLHNRRPQTWRDRQPEGADPGMQVRFIVQFGDGPKPEPYPDEIEAFVSRDDPTRFTPYEDEGAA